MTDPQNRWLDVFHQGLEDGRRIGMDLKKIQDEANRAPQAYRFQYLDGAAHGIEWPFADLPQCLDAIRRDIDPTFQEMMLFGPIQTMAQRYGAEPEKIDAYLQSVPAEFMPHIGKGLSIGLMRRYKRDLPGAIKVIVRLDNRYQGDCFEELGWWLGNNHGDDLTTVKAIVQTIPPEFHGLTYHGYIRGVELSDEIDRYENLISGIDQQYQFNCYQALGWKLRNWNWTDPVKAEELLKKIKRQDMIPAIKSELQPANPDNPQTLE